MTVEIQDVEFVVDIDEDAIEDAVHRLRGEVLDGGKCPECGGRAKLSVTTEARETTSDKRSVILEGECTEGEECEWEHRLMAGAGLTLEAKDPRGEA